jgi:hypothetical protein
MAKKIGNKGIDSVKGSSSADRVKGTEIIDTVGKVLKTHSVAGTGAVGRIGNRRPTRTMTMQEREQLFRILNEEAEKMFGGPNGLAPEQRKVVEGAVKMALASGLETEEDEKSNTPPKRR